MGFDLVSRGYAKIYLDYSRESGVFVLAVEKIFSFRADWHQDDQAKPLVARYQLALDSALKADWDLQPCAVHCAHCGIRFLTHPRNAGRRNLHCPFGCREHHRRQSSNRRSTAYYQTAAGKWKKHGHNRRRRHSSADEQPVVEASIALESRPPPDQPTDPAPSEAELRLDAVVLDESSLTSSPVLPYLRMIVSLIEGVHFNFDEFLQLLRRGLRQHSIVSRSRREYVLSYLRQHPP